MEIRKQNATIPGVLVAVCIAVLFLMVIFAAVKRSHGQELKDVVIVCFTASYCENCPQMKANCKEVARSEGTEWIEVDSPSRPDLRQKWGVDDRTPTTLIMYKKDNKLVVDTKVIGISDTKKLVGYVKDARSK